MANVAFDWKSLVAGDERYAAQDAVGSRLAAGTPGEEWKTEVVAAYLRDDQLRESSRTPAARIGVLPVVAGALKVVGSVLFGVKTKGDDVLSTDLVLGPEEHALVLRDGRVLGTYTQARVTRGTGFLAWLKGLVGTTPNYRILLVDASPFEVRLPFGKDGGTTTLLTKDHLVLGGHVALRLQFDVANLPNVLGLVRGRSLLDRATVGRHVRDALFARVLVPVAARHLGSEVRGNAELQDKVRGDATRVLEEAFRDVGLLVRGVDVAWETTAEERQAVGARRRGLAELDAELAANAAHQAEKQALLRAAEKETARARGQAEVERIRLEIETLKAEQGLLLRRRSQALEREDEEETRRIRREDDLARARAGAEVEAAKAAAWGGLTPEQILAIRSAESPETARALAERYRADAAASASEKVEKAVERAGETAQRMAVNYGEQMASVARAAAGARTEAARTPCVHCGAGLLPAWKVCPSCGTEVKAAKS